MNVFLNSEDYSTPNCLFWGVFYRHCQEANQALQNKYLGKFAVHALAAAIQLLPVISQIVSFIEKSLFFYHQPPSIPPLAPVLPTPLFASLQPLEMPIPLYLPPVFPLRIEKLEGKERAERFNLDLIKNFLKQTWYSTPLTPKCLKPMRENSRFFHRKEPFRTALERRIIENVLIYYPERTNKLIYFGVGSSLFLQDWIILARLIALGYKNFEIHLADSRYETNEALDYLAEPNFVRHKKASWKDALEVFNSSLQHLGAETDITVHGKVTEKNAAQYPENIHIATMIAFEGSFYAPVKAVIYPRLHTHGHIYAGILQGNRLSTPIFTCSKRDETINVRQDIVNMRWPEEQYQVRDRPGWNPAWEVEFPDIKRVITVNERVYPIYSSR